ncbi:MAG TPA: hypothetical protein VMM13_06820, partial [Euzebya sp.]|nr:hypothetical protein [Euzebya sp.]
GSLAAGPDPDTPRPGGRGPNVAHLVAGLAGEPEGMAGHFLRRAFGEMAARLALHEAIGAASLRSLATTYIALPVLARPCWTLELLQAARRVGGEDLDHLLQGCGVNLAGFPDDLLHRMPGPTEVGALLEAPETFGRLSLVDVGFSHDADLAVARTRAHGGDSHDLLVWLGADSATREALATAPAVPLQAVVDRARLSDMAVDSNDLVTAITHLSLRAALKRP